LHPNKQIAAAWEGRWQGSWHDACDQADRVAWSASENLAFAALLEAVTDESFAKEKAVESIAQTILIREFIGNPFHP
jgi:hypothetical protein